VKPDDHNADSSSLAERVLKQIAYCLRQGCVICIEHTPRIRNGSVTSYSSNLI